MRCVGAKETQRQGDKLDTREKLTNHGSLSHLRDFTRIVKEAVRLVHDQRTSDTFSHQVNVC